MTQSPQRPLTIAVVIPTHNRPAPLRAAVRSVLDQNVGPGVKVRPVVVDEASQPQAQASLGTLADLVTIVRNETPHGPAAARNQGAAAVEADIVAFLDDDDWWLPGKISECIAAFRAYPEASLVFHQVRFAHDPTPAGQRSHLVADPAGRMLRSQPPHIDGVMVRAAVHDAVRFDESLHAAEDLDYLLRAAMAGPVVEIDSVLAVFGAPDSHASAITLERRIEGRQRFREKHSMLFDRAAKAHSDLRIGHQLRIMGQRKSAAAAFGRALLRRPAWASPWKGLLALVLPDSAVARLSRIRKQATTPTGSRR